MNAMPSGCYNVSEGFQAAIAEMEEALKEEGFAEEGPLGVFVRTQKQAVIELARLVGNAEETFAAKITEMHRFVESSERRSENELAKLRTLLTGADKVMEMAREAVKDAGAAQVLTVDECNKSIAQIASRMSGELLRQTKGWLLIKQNQLNRVSAWRLAGLVTIVSITILLTGYQVRAWQDAPATEALARCATSSFQVRIGENPNAIAACPVTELSTRDLKDLPAVIRHWLADWLP
jgi:hypothetical protein